MSKFILDFNIYSSQERLNAVKQIDLSQLNHSELETVSNYILYGKDEDGTSITDRKEVKIKTKFNSYNKEKFVSLDEMMESPTFDEAALTNNKTIYKKIKPQIDKTKAEKVPGMKELWKSIEAMDRKLKSLKEIERPTTEQRKQIYYLTHYLIQLRTQQYYLMDSCYPTIVGQKNKAQWHDFACDSQMNYPVLPCGVMAQENDKEFMCPKISKRFEVAPPQFYSEEDIEEMIKKNKFFIDFRIFDHVYQLVLHYGEIQAQVEYMPDSLLHNLLWTLDFYIEKAGLSEQQKLIVRDKKMRIPNKEIVKHLQEELSIHHQENYVSTIWNKCVRLINEAAELHWDEFLCRNYEKAWKVCNKCGRILLRDSRNFVRKKKSADGLTSRCKICDKKMRQH